MADVAADTVEQLVHTYGFPLDKCEQAVAAMTDKSDIQMAISWLLDHGEEDKGGAVMRIHCPHLDDPDFKLIKESEIELSHSCADGCESTENWLCFTCGATRCSRYVNHHNFAHYESTKSSSECHCIAISLSDLSTWCYKCESYIMHHRLRQLESSVSSIKFMNPIVPAETYHGKLGDTFQWEKPHEISQTTSGSSHEFADTTTVLREKARELAGLIQRSKCTVVYTGAEIDGDIKRSGDFESELDRVLAAQPTAAHRTLASMHRAGLVSRLISQSNDGLAQKAGFPQQHINEIYGSWYDPSNPVTLTSSSLRGDLVKDLVSYEQKADLVIVLGPSAITHTTSDRLISAVTQRAKFDSAMGVVLVGSQSTSWDASAALKVFACVEDFMAVLSEELFLDISDSTPAFVPSRSHVFQGLPYNAVGEFDPSESLSLTLTPGTNVALVNQPDWDARENGSMGAIQKENSDGSFTVLVGETKRLLGRWWLEEAAAGKVSHIPLISSNRN